MITLLQQNLPSNYGDVTFEISQREDSTNLIARAHLNDDRIYQWEKNITQPEATKNDIQSFKKQIIDDLKRDEHIQRILKLAQRRQSGAPTFPNQVERTHTCEQINNEFSHFDKQRLEQQDIQTQTFKVCGRIISKRVIGKTGFVELQDGYGTLQLYLSKEKLGDQFIEFKRMDNGDIINAQGSLFRTDTDQLSIHCATIELLVKALRPMPNKFHGLKDTEQRYRERYVDLLSNKESKKIFVTRTKIVKKIREFFDSRDFMEVETPMLHPIPGGATAKPFATHHNALDMDLYLRIAPELYLKRLIVGGFERVYEINRNFRNEGLSTRHNPEFSMIEFYQAYADHQYLMDLTEKLFTFLCEQITHTTRIQYQDHDLDFSKPFQRFTIKQAILKHHQGVEASSLETLEACKELAKKLTVTFDGQISLGKLVTEIFEQTIEHQLIQPTFITEYPIEVSPLARRNDNNPEVTDRFELFIAGREIANGFSELNDPHDQAERFRQQVKISNTDNDEELTYDSDYINALQYGMPPTAGEGIGIDRLIMLFTNTPSIRDVLLFPLMRPNNPISSS